MSKEKMPFDKEDKKKGFVPLETGKLPERVLKRSIVNTISLHRPEVIVGSAVGEDCAAIELGPDEIMVLSTDPITGTAKDIGSLAITVTMNDLASAGATPVGVMLTVLLPQGTVEADIREIMRDVNTACEAAEVEVIGGHTEVTGVVSQCVISVTGVAKVKKGQLISTGGGEPGMKLIATKWIGIEGTSIIAKEKKEELKRKLPESLIDEAIKLDKYISVQKEGLMAARLGAKAMHDVTEGGIYGALWELAEASKTGLRVELNSIPIRQETVEICEFYNIDPYKLISSGCMLIAAPEEAAEEIMKGLSTEGIPGVIIGELTEGRDRIVELGDEIRFLEPPASDEFHKVLG